MERIPIASCLLGLVYPGSRSHNPSTMKVIAALGCPMINGAVLADPLKIMTRHLSAARLLMVRPQYLDGRFTNISDGPLDSLTRRTDGLD